MGYYATTDKTKIAPILQNNEFAAATVDYGGRVCSVHALNQSADGDWFANLSWHGWPKPIRCNVTDHKIVVRTPPYEVHQDDKDSEEI